MKLKKKVVMCRKEICTWLIEALMDLTANKGMLKAFISSIVLLC
jgi:hypothetical protein